MVLTVHHLQVSQSERVPWLCEELDIPYNLQLHQRAPIFAPQSIKDLHPTGQAPVIQDGSLTLAESAACVEYIIHVYGDGKLALPPSHKNYADYLYWFHFANGNLQPLLLSLVQLSTLDPNHPAVSRTTERLKRVLALMDARLHGNAWLAGDDFTAADIMTVFTLTTMRAMYSLDLTEHHDICAYLKRATARDGYKRARAKADPDLELMVDGKPPQNFLKRIREHGKI